MPFMSKDILQKIQNDLLEQQRYVQTATSTAKMNKESIRELRNTMNLLLDHLELEVLHIPPKSKVTKLVKMEEK